MSNSIKELSFTVSAGLKNVIGRDLINDRYVAIFELVKNSYDARAHHVKISFLNDTEEITTISIKDDGIGMNYSDIVGKWLFVAYSEKKKQNRDKSDYRNEIGRNVAGAKGVGRFSCDRLGSKLRLISKKKGEKLTHVIDIDWNRFEVDDLNNFGDISIEYYVENRTWEKDQGTILEITGLRESWTREDLLRLKKSLMKLIIPDYHNDLNDIFDIEIIAPREKPEDEALKEKKVSDRDLVNGVIENDIFEKLNIKTTNITVTIDASGKAIETVLSDRGEQIFKIVEKNTEYILLNNIQFSLFYLNRSAKINFKKQMGIEPVKYGSVFIYKSGFRVNPYGDPGDDSFGIDRRKQQGYARTLGTRDIIGRISILGDNDEFIETSSRANGFIKTDSVNQLLLCFNTKVLRVLERYVINILQWNNPLQETDEINPENISEKIISEFTDLSSRGNLVSIEYNPKLLESINTITDELSSSISKLEQIGSKDKNQAILELVASVKKQTEGIKKDNLELDRQNKETSEALFAAQKENKIRNQQVFFLKGAANNNVENLLKGMHTVFTASEAINGNLDLIENIIENDKWEKDELIELFQEVKKANKKINKLSELAIHGAQNLKSEEKANIRSFIQQYLSENLSTRGLEYNVDNREEDCNCFFDAASVGLIIDNIISNSKKAKADAISIEFEKAQHHIDVRFKDNGVGLAPDVSPDLIFEYGASTTNTSITHGFGIGLSHIKQLSQDMGGNVFYDQNYHQGFGLIVRFKR